MLTQPGKLQCSSWSGSKARPNMVPKWAWHGPKNRNSKEMGLRPCKCHGRTILEPFWPSLISRPARAIKFSKLSQGGLRHMCMKCPLLETMLGPCFDHVKTMFGLSLAPYQLELWHFFKTDSIWSKKHVLGVHVFWPCQCHILTMLTPYLA